MPLPPSFASKSPATIRSELAGLPASTLDAALRFHSTGDLRDLAAMLPGMVRFHLPRGAPPPPAELREDLRLVEDLGLDSLALAELAFKLDELLGVGFETHELRDIRTVGDFLAFLQTKIGNAPPP